MPGSALLAALLSVAIRAVGAEDSLADAERLLAKKDYRGAETALRELVKTDPSNARVHGNLAIALLSQGKLREAVDEGRLAAAFGPRLAEARYIYGLALRANGQLLEAAREFERAAALNPGELVSAEAAAAAYAAAADERAAPAYEKLIGLEPDRPALRAEFAEYLWSVGELDRGNAMAAAALEKFPDSADLHARYGRALFDQERFLDAGRELGRARALGDRRPSTQSLLGSALWQAGRPDAAAAALEAGVADHPDNASLRQDLGRLLLLSRQAPKALPHLEWAARRSPGKADAQLDLGRAFEAVGRLPEAEEAYRRSVALAPGLSSPHYGLGRLLVRQGRRPEGEKELAIYRDLYERAARLVEESRGHAAEIAMAWSELRRGNARAALERFASFPESGETLTGRASALARLGRHGEAVEVLERARQLSPDSARIQSLLAAERARVAETP